MQAIETLLRECGEHVAYALDERGERVHAGNAYQAARPPVSDGQYDVVYAVECGGDWFGALNVWSPYDDDGGPVLTGCIRIDHHRPGDPGYGRPPSEFFAASSLGQVCAVLGLAILYSHRDDACRVLSDQEGQIGWDFAWSGVGDIPSASGGVFATVRPGAQSWPTGKHGMWEGLPVPERAANLTVEARDVMLIAAADHCLGGFAGGYES